MQTHDCLSGRTSRASLHSLHTAKLIAIKKTMNEAVRPLYSLRSPLVFA
ncbi:hypothetical protein HMPREF9944_00861 [Segatella maculosa OT 289]|uniref:Uncharacterized protein n=1 Tax=Segatella maculosa OT 289 TaxID=999422 RepID=H1HL17_9BACT|nr:hypothetical protein HMPREF9944_00861 [Segatella maculosa OT 289]